MLEINEVKRIVKNYKTTPVTVEGVARIAEQVSKLVERRYRYSCGLEEFRFTEKWSYNFVEQPNAKIYGFFNSPDGQNGEFYWALRDVGFAHHFRMAEYHWGVRMGKIILTYTEGDVDVFEEPVGYKSPKS